MAEFLDEVTGQISGYLRRYRNRPLLRAAMAASALVAIADGSVSFGERVRVDQVLQTLEALKVFDPHDGVNLFNEYTDAILRSPKSGRAKAMKAIQTVVQDTDTATATLIIRICLAVASARRTMHLAEKIEILSLCSTLKVEPESCGLTPDYPDGTTA